LGCPSIYISNPDRFPSKILVWISYLKHGGTQYGKGSAQSQEFAMGRCSYAILRFKFFILKDGS
jgi:hypothetical protein